MPCPVRQTAFLAFAAARARANGFILRELAGQLRPSGRGVVVLAPQLPQVVEIEKAAFPSSTTAANFLIKRGLADSAAIVVDEAGRLAGGRCWRLSG